VIKDKEGRYLVVPVATLEKGQTLWLINADASASQSENGQGKQRGQEEPETEQGEMEPQEERRGSSGGGKQDFTQKHWGG